MKKHHWILLIIALLLAGFVSYYASSNPDGLEKVAEQLGFHSTAVDPPFEVIPDYSFPLQDKPFWSNFLAGIIGTIIVWLLVYLIGRSYRRKKKQV